VRTIAGLASIFGFLGVAAGAFGAHVLRERIPPESVEVFETGARYQMIHALAMLFAAWIASRAEGGPGALAGGLFAAGIVLFSGSLYALALTGIRPLGAITPVGGLCFLAGWAVLAYAAFRTL
jgi:uncharacterized membrane protein YgdD (TMEM256/DUF423 family)